MKMWIFYECIRCNVKRILNYFKFCLGCLFIVVDKLFFKEYIDVLGEWVILDCLNNYMYSVK